MSKYLFDVVLVDFYGTIADGDREQVETTCRHLVRDYSLSLSAEDLAVKWGANFFAAADDSNHDRFRTLYECECISLRKTMRELSVECDPVPYADELQRYWANPALHSEAKEALASLPVPVCCLSNVDEADLRAAIAAHGLEFDGVVSSEQARSYKPDAKIFEYALEMMGSSPTRAIHVGDSLHSDILGAQALGISAVWLERDGRINDIGSATPDFTINSLSQVASLLD